MICRNVEDPDPGWVGAFNGAATRGTCWRGQRRVECVRSGVPVAIEVLVAVGLALGPL